MKRKRIHLQLVLLIAASFFCPCPAGAAALRFAYASVATPLSGVWAAQEIGAFKKYSLDVQLIYISSSTTNVQALLGGSLDVATPGGGSAVLAVSRGAPISAIGSVMNRPPMTLYVQPEITRLEQLKGQVVGITRFGSTGHSVTTLMLRKLGMAQAVTLRPVGGNPELQAAFEQKMLAGFVTTVRPKAAARSLFNAADLDIPYAMNLITTTHDFLQRNPDTAERLLKAYIEGVGAMVHDKELAARIFAKYFRRNDPGFLEDTYSIVNKFMERTPRVDPRTISTVLEFEPIKGAEADALAAKLIDNSIVDRLVRDGFIERVFGKTKR
ncbi:MAG: ABC transporter substrate-binding protein [Deltaproteobacteria bacterium]|nr:ABC transporter substrate-binding protein [Deltaproteobacteria bacterium]